MTRFKEPTHTELVLQALINAEDFLTMKQLVEMKCGNVNQVSAACWHLRKRHAAAVEIQDGLGYWYACPDDDDRSRKMVMRQPEEKPRKLRRTKCPVVKA